MMRGISARWPKFEMQRAVGVWLAAMAYESDVVHMYQLEKAYNNQRAAPPEVSRICSARSTLAGWWGAVLTFVLTAVKSLPAGVGKWE